MAKKLTAAWRLLYLVMGTGLIAYAVYGRDVQSGVATVVLAVLGVLLWLRALGR